MRNGAYGPRLGPTRFQVIEVFWQARLKDARSAQGDSTRPIYHGFLRPALTVRHRATWEGQMLGNLPSLGLF